jgi:hypothetical protein
LRIISLERRIGYFHECGEPTNGEVFSQMRKKLEVENKALVSKLDEKGAIIAELGNTITSVRIGLCDRNQPESRRYQYGYKDGQQEIYCEERGEGL